MNRLLLNAIVLALSSSVGWSHQKLYEFYDDIRPLVSKQDIGYHELCPIYDKYIHRLDRVDMVLKEIER